MSLAIYVKDKQLRLPTNFKIEWVERNYAFEGDTIYGDYMIPITAPLKGNEAIVAFAHEIGTPNRKTVLKGARLLDDGNLQYTGALLLSKSRNKKNISFSFLSHDIAYFFGKKKIAELDVAPLNLGATDADVLQAATDSIDEDRIYVFPPFQANNFYGDSANFPASIEANSYNTVDDKYETADNFSKPLVPFFRLPNLIEYFMEQIGYSVKGRFFKDAIFKHIVATHFASMDRHKNQNDVAYELEDTNIGQNDATGLNEVFTVEAGHNMFKPGEADCEIKEEIDIIVKVKFNVPDYDHGTDFYYEYIIDTQIVLSDFEFINTFTPVTVLATYRQRRGSPLGINYDGNDGNIGDTITHRHNTAASDLGKYVFVRTSTILNIYRLSDPQPLNPYNPGIYTLIQGRYWAYPNVNIHFAMRYLGQSGTELIEPNIDWGFFLPDITFEELLVGVKKDYNLRFNFHPYKKELEVNPSVDLLRAKVERLDGLVQDDYELIMNKQVKGFSYKQEFENFETDIDEEKEAALQYKEFLGSFAGTDNFPDATWNSYVVDSISNEVYVSVFNLSGSVLGSYAGTFDWFKSHQRIRNTAVSLGNGVEEIKATFLPLFLKEVSGDYVLNFEGIGKSRHSGEKPDVSGFRAVNFMGIDNSVSGWDAPFATHTNRYIDGDERADFMVLTYDADNPRSIFSLLCREWCDFMLRREEFELVLLHNKITNLSLNKRYVFAGATFLIKELRKQRDSHGLIAFEATAYKV